MPPEAGPPLEPPARHRSPRRLAGRDPLAAALIVLALLWIGVSIGGPLTGRTTFQADTILSTFAPWKAAAPNNLAITGYCNGDTIDGVQPGRVEGVRDLRKGQITQLDPYVVGGVNSTVGSNEGIYDPVTFVPFTTLPFHVAPAYEKVLELLVILLGMVLWVRRLGMSTAAGVVGGLVYGSSGFMVSWTNWPQTSVACWIPMMFWTAERLVQRRSLSSSLLLAIPFASMLLGGFPAVTGWTAYAIAAYLAMRLLSQHRPARALVEGGLVAGLGVAIGAGISAFMLLPFKDGYAAQPLGYRDTLGRDILHHQALTTALFPNGYGGCAFNHGTPFFLGGAYVESEMFVGSAAAVLIVVALTGRLRPGVPVGPRPFMVVMGAFVANQMLLNDPLSRAVATLPVFSNSVPGRLRVLFGLAAALLAAMGFDRLVARAWQPSWWRRPRTALVVLAWLIAALGAALAARTTHLIANQHHVGRHLLQGIIDALLVAALVAVVVVVAARWQRARVPAALAVAVILAVQSGAYARGIWSRDPNSSYYPRTPTTDYLATDLGSWRVTGDHGSFRSGVSTLYEDAIPGGHTFAQPEWQQLLTSFDPTVAADGPTFFSLSLDAGNIGSPVLDAMSVRYVLRGEEDVLLGTPQPAPATDGMASLSLGHPVSAPVGSTPLRGVGVTFASTLSIAGSPYAALHVDLLDPAGTVVSSGTRRIYLPMGAGQAFVVAVTDTGTTDEPLTARVSLVGDPHPVEVAAQAGVAALSLVTRPDDGLRVVVSDGSVLYERTSALPHIRWASSARELPVGEQVAAVAAGLPSGQIVVAPGSPGAGGGQPATVSPAKVSVTKDAGTEVSAGVDASAPGYLVVSNAFQRGWSATVDGATTPIVDADHGLQAVPVPAGHHTVTLTYNARGLNAGILVTLGTLVLYVILWAVVAGRSWGARRRTGPGSRRGSGDSGTA